MIFAEIVYKKKTMPHAVEALEYLSSKYNLYILSNGFRELQEQKCVRRELINTLKSSFVGGYRCA